MNEKDQDFIPQTIADFSLSPTALTFSERSAVLPMFEITAAQPKPVVHHPGAQRFRRVKQIGRGGSSDVLLVQDNDIHRLVAMKTIRSESDASSRVIRFVEEIKLTGQLDHPNIIPIHDVGLNTRGQYYYTMKYVEGDTLFSVIRKLKEGDPEAHAKYSFERRIKIFIEILYALDFAHERGIIHRDLKPANIMLGRHGEVIVMDWGIAKSIAPDAHKELVPIDLLAAQEDKSPAGPLERNFSTKDGKLIGTPAYMSPEQIRGENNSLDQRSDIYSACALFYELLALQHYLHPYHNDIAKLRELVPQNTPIRPEDLTTPHQGRVPRELAFFLRQGMQRDPNKRFQSVREMLNILEPTSEGKICAHCPSTTLKRGTFEIGKYLDNHRILGVVIFAILIGFTIFGMLQFVMLFL